MIERSLDQLRQTAAQLLNEAETENDITAVAVACAYLAKWIFEERGGKRLALAQFESFARLIKEEIQ